jgi:PQQ-like domain
MGRGLLLVVLLAALAGRQAASPRAATAVHETCLALVDAQTAAVRRTWPCRGNELPSSAADGQGGWFVTSWTRAGTIAHLASNGDVIEGWQAKTPNLDWRAESIVRVGSRLYLDLVDEAHNKTAVEAIDAVTGRRLWLHPFHVNIDVGVLAATASRIYVGGENGPPGLRGVLIALNAGDGSRLRWKAQIPKDSVSAGAISGSRLYVGVDNTIVALSTRTGRRQAWHATVQGDGISNIVVVGRTVIVGGTFAFGAFDAATAKPRPWASQGLSGNVFGVAGRTVYVGGNDRSGAVGYNLGAFDGVTGALSPWLPKLAAFVTVSGITRSGGNVLVGGDFTSSLG